jgi:hypothetical protein
VDPHWFQYEAGSSILGQCGSGSSSGNPIQIFLMTRNWEKITADKKNLDQKLEFIYSQASMKDVQAMYRRSLQPSIKNIKHFKN